MHLNLEPVDRLIAVLDAYIIEEIKRQEEARKRSEEEGRPRIRIDIDREAPDPDDEDEAEPEDSEDGGVIRIEIDSPTIPADSDGCLHFRLSR